MVARPSNPIITGEKRQILQNDPYRGAKKRPRRTGSSDGGVCITPKTYTTRSTHANPPDTGVDLCDDASGEAFPHGTGGSRARRVKSSDAGISVQTHAELIREVKHLRENLSQTQGTLKAVQMRLQTLEQQQPRMEGQLDVLIRMLQPSARAPPHSRGSDADMT